jgi:hypothetical protein
MRPLLDEITRKAPHGEICLYVSAFGETVIPEPVRHFCLMRAVRKFPGQPIKIKEYAARLIARWASATAYYLWRHP